MDHAVTTSYNYEVLNDLLISSLSITSTSQDEAPSTEAESKVSQLNKLLFRHVGESLKKQAEQSASISENRSLKEKVNHLQDKLKEKKSKIDKLKNEIDDIKSKHVEEQLKLTKELELSRLQMQERMHGKETSVQEKKIDSEFKTQLGVAGIQAGGKLLEKGIEVGPTHAMNYWNKK